MKKSKIVLVGNGKFGKNYIHTLKNFDVDLQIANRYNWKDLIKSSDGVIVATPPESHIEIASYALDLKIPTMIEKPLCLTLSETKAIQKFTAPVLVNHIHLFSEGYQKLKEIKNISSIHTVGLGTNYPRNYSGLYDYGCHDLAMILDLLKEYPEKVNISKIDTDIFMINLKFENAFTSSMVGSNFHEKRREICIKSDGIEYKYDDLNKKENNTPLHNAVSIFLNAINGKYDSRLGIGLSLQILKILESFNYSP